MASNDEPKMPQNHHNAAVPAIRGPGISNIDRTEVKLVRYQKRNSQNALAKSQKMKSEGTFSNINSSQNMMTHSDEDSDEEEEVKGSVSHNSGFGVVSFDNRTYVRLGYKLGESQTTLSHPDPSCL